jgi:mono/diheme cytochrome c family protein
MRKMFLLLPFLFTTLAFAGNPPGEALYRQKACAGCHGTDGSGDTPVGRSMGARDLRSEQVQGQTDAQLAATIAAGRGKMAAFKNSLSPAQIRDVVAWIRVLAKKQ